MEVFEAIRTRRSIRKFKSQDVPDEVIGRILTAGIWAPSGMDNQPWRFAVIRDTELKEKISPLTRYGRIILSANVLIAVFLDAASIYNRTKDVQAIGACIENMLLALHSLGLGGVWLGEILKSAKELKELLVAPEAYELMAVIALGYPAGPHPEPTGRKQLDELIFFRK